MSCLYWNDNLNLLNELKNGGTVLDFVYIDPPFFSDAKYSASVKIGNESVKTPAYTDKWDTLDDFLDMLEIRLRLIRDLLKDSGSVAVQLDTHAVHYAKVMMDRVFGRENFVNDIIWSYKSGGAGSRGFAKKHDNILLYSKTKDFYFAPQKERSYNRGNRPYRFKGVEEFEDEHGRWYTLVNRKDVISVDMVGRTSSERTGYATQKPEKLLEILVQSCCPEGGTAADFFCGSGSLGAVCAKHGRQFILCDRSAVAVSMTNRRLQKLNAEYEYIKAPEMHIPGDIDRAVTEELKKYL